MDVAPIVGSAIAAMTSPVGAVLDEAAQLALDLGAEASQSVALVGLPKEDKDEYQNPQPKSGINFVAYNEKFKVVPENTGVIMVQDNIHTIQTLATDRIIIRESGFLEVYAHNEAQTPVYFDNMTVSRRAGAALEVNAYYPYGMLNPGLSSSNGAAPNAYKYNAKELQKELNLNWLDYGARMYDPAVDRWWVPDPVAEKYYNYNISPYAFVLNNPIRFIDPNGEDVYMYFYVANGEDDDSEDARMFWASALTRANDMLKNGQIKEGDAYTFRAISDLGKLGEAVDNVVKEMSPNFGETAEFGLWSHGALDGPIGNKQTTGPYSLGSQMTPEGWGNINFNWKNDGMGTRAMFFGCRTGSSEGGTVTPWTQTISGNPNMQNVEVWGQTMRSWPSIYPDWGQSTANIRKGIHGGPTYMIGSDKGKFTQFNRVTGKPYQAYPMGIYQNGKLLRNQYQSYR